MSTDHEWRRPSAWWLLPAARIAAPPTNEAHRRCEIFAWIGQALHTCDRCGEPYWDHLYTEAARNARPLFRVKQFDEFLDTWVWAPVGSLITRPRAIVARTSTFRSYGNWIERPNSPTRGNL